MSHKHLNYLQRCQILALWKAGFNQTQIAKEVGVHKSTICRELKRNITFVRTKLGYWTYKPDYAQYYADDRRKAKRYFYKFTKEVEDFVREKLKEEWSPEQISGYAKKWDLFSIRGLGEIFTKNSDSILYELLGASLNVIFAQCRLFSCKLQLTYKLLVRSCFY